MKLELKHVAPYLPYGLKIKTNNIIREMVCDRKIDDEEEFKTKVPIFNIITGIGHKPIIRPLSDLIDNILDDNNDENYQLNCELAGLLNSTHCDYFVKALIENKFYSVDIRLWNDIEEFLNKNHFDWKYNLIQQGLAIDINTIHK